MRQFLEELHPHGERPLLDILSPARPDVGGTSDILEWIETAANGRDGAFAITDAYRSLELAKFMRERTAYRSSWRVNDLEQIRQELRRFCGTDPSANLEEPPKLLDRIRAEFAAMLEARLTEEAEKLGAYPRALEGLLSQLERRLPDPTRRKVLRDLQNIDNFEQWLDTGRAWGSLAQQLMPARLERLHDEARRWLNTEPRDIDYRIWLRQAIESAARDVISKLRAAEEARWEKVDELRASAAKLLTSAVAPIENRTEQIYLDGRAAQPARVLQQELARFDEADRRKFHRALMNEFFSFYEDYRASNDDSTVARWIAQTRRLFERQLASAVPGDSTGRGDRYRLISPESLFDDREVTSALLRCRSRVFQPGRVSSPAALRIARLLVPDGFRDRGGYYTKMRNWSKGLLNASTSSLQANGSTEENRIVVVVEDLFHPAEDISGIYDYHAHYAGQENRLLFHIHRQWPSLFPPLITRSGDRTRVPCGNPDCNDDIRTVPRTALFCPGCHEPIRNRCGNGGCLANDLADRPDRPRFIESRTCPACRGFLRTSWWKCADHGDVPMDKQNCPYCVREGRPVHRISPRPDRLNRFTCAGCASRNLAPPFTASGSAARYLTDGVNGHDLLDAQAQFRTLLNQGAFCPKCASQLAPTCPLPDPEHSGREHYLYRHRDGHSVDRFRCYLHPDATFYTCGHCDFPMLPGATRCGRCGNELTDCRFCTPLFGVRIPAADAATRCPNCFTRQVATPRLDAPPAVQPAEPEELFCSNLFGCPAGGHLNDTTFPGHTSECPFCRSSELPLLRAFTRVDHLEACTFCSSLFGLEPRKERPIDGDCCLCGHAYAAKIAHPATAQRIACILRCTTDDGEAFRQLLTLPRTEDARSLDTMLREFLQDIKRSAVRRVVAARFEHILALYERQFGCRTERGGHRGGEPCEC
jgi:hypothetical protein